MRLMIYIGDDLLINLDYGISEILLLTSYIKLLVQEHNPQFVLDKSLIIMLDWFFSLGNVTCLRFSYRNMQKLMMMMMMILWCIMFTLCFMLEIIQIIYMINNFLWTYV